MFFCPVCKYKLNIVRTVEGKAGSGFFECKACDFRENIKNGTTFIEFTKTKRTFFDPSTIDLDLFPRKIIDKCKNKKCNNKEVIVWKDDDFNVLYVCVKCKEIIHP